MRRVARKQRPDGAPVAADFEVLEDVLPRPGPNEALVAARFLSMPLWTRVLPMASMSITTTSEAPSPMR